MQGCGGKEVPQRQRIAGNAAVVEGDWGGNAVQEAHSKDAAEKPFRNGREMRKLLPLWKVAGETMPSRKPIARMRRKSHSTTEWLREGEENSAETPDHCPLGAKQLSPPKGKVWKGVKKGRLCRPSPSFGGICFLRSHIPTRLRRALQKMKNKKPNCGVGAQRLSLPLGEGLDGGKTRPTLSAIPLFPQKGPGADSAGAFLRKEGDSNPRNPQGVQQFSRLPRSTTPASFLIFGLQI